ncbi:MAG TPA: TerC/Alx family metal homeostasis membrane protein [Alcanivoracaceae bacterium]|nr:TerC/Alx family metal homeostasis membrane protein [Alcanivoracaceae bacterium]
MESVGNVGLWGVFAALVLGLLTVDLLLFKGGRAHRVTMKEAAMWSLVWVMTALLFCVGLWWYLYETSGASLANEQAMLFLTAYVMEKSLAIDNVFVWILIFGYFSVPLELQRRVLLYGILGAIILRTVMIFAGSWLISEFHWVLYIFGAFLLFTGAKMLFPEEEASLENNKLLGWLSARLRLTKGLEGERFFVRQQGVLFATPLFLVLVLVELSDVVFAVDSIPAVFAITTDPFIVLTSNLFAILGLRAMYFLVADMSDRFGMLHYGLAFILLFVGAKMLIEPWYEVPLVMSLSVILGVLAITVVGNVIYNRRKA